MENSLPLTTNLDKSNSDELDSGLGEKNHDEGSNDSHDKENR